MLLSSQELFELAKSAGFDLCGAARAEPIPEQTLRSWLEAGFDADMDWMARRFHERLDVQLLLPGARTVLAFGCSYETDAGRAAAKSPIARYARGRDYHATMKDRVRTFRRLLSERHPLVKTYAGVDSGPLMEKVWAARAGLGYVGRNGCFISDAFGSYVVLAAVVLDAEVDAYAGGPSADQCGTCTLCVSSCPTEALDGRGYVDARRCLSYQTIENEGAVPEELREGFRNVVFGCDICQDVCPLNRSAPVRNDYRFLPRAVGTLSALELAALTKEQYDALIPGTALARAGFDGLRRNAAYALGAMRDASAVEVLRALSNDASAHVRDAASWALSRLV